MPSPLGRLSRVAGSLSLGILLTGLPATAADTPAASNAELLKEIDALKARLQQLEDQVRKNSADTEAAKKAAEQATAQTEATKQAVAAAAPVLDKLSSGQIQVGHTNLSFGGWMEGTMTWRNHNELASASSTNFGTPFPKSVAYNDHEFRADARNTRITINMNSPWVDDTKLGGRLEFDWQSVGSNTTQNNDAWAPRLRHAFMEVDNKVSGWHFVAGQTYALSTPYGNQILGDGSSSPNKAWTMLPLLPITNLDPLDDLGPAGMNAPKLMELRVVKTFTNSALAMSLEAPTVTWGSNVAGTAPTYTGTTLAPGSNSQFNNNTSQNLSLSSVPDVVVKGTWQPDPAYFFEGYGVFRSYRDMAGTTPLSGTGRTSGFGAGFDTYIKAIPGTLDITGGMGYGSLGGYTGNGIADVTFDATGKPVAVKEGQGWLGIIGHVNGNLDVIAYSGIERSKAAGVSGVNYGWGNPNFLNSGCAILGGTCNGSVKTIWDAELGAVWRIYNGPYGHLDFLPQITYLDKTLFTDVNGNGPSAKNLAVDLAFRFYPF
jgi:hypothetical protein